MLNTHNKDVDLRKLRVAIVHYWFVGRAGGERVVEAMAEVFPQADLFCLVVDRDTLAPILKTRKLQTSFLQQVPGAIKFHRHFLFLQAIALEQYDLSEYDLVLSSESGPAKGVLTTSKTCHICYCHSPMRYIWQLYPQYLKGMSPLVKMIFTLTAHYMRMWDYASAARVDYFVANSEYISSQIRKYYGRDNTVIYPPVDTTEGKISKSTGDYYLTVGRLVDYKRVDLAVEACKQLGRPLRIIGSGPQLKELKKLAGPSVQFLGKVSDAELRENLANCKALLFPGEEDFGIVPVEAQSFGRPVIAYASGGILETVRNLEPEESLAQDATGILFPEQTPESLVNAILEFEAREMEFSPIAIREHSFQFDKEVFKHKIAEFVRFAVKDFRRRNAVQGLKGSSLSVSVPVQH